MTPLLELGPHAGFILAAYGVSLIAITGLIGWIALDARNQSRILAELEAQGIQRRSKKTARRK